MPTFEQRSPIPARRETLFAYHARPGALERLIPPWQPTRIIENDGPLREGKRVVIETKLGPIWKRWIAEHFDYVEGRRFRDRQTAGPFKAWVHTHETLDADGADASGARSTLVDHVDYEIPFGPIGALGARFIRGELARMFAFRHARTIHDLRNGSYFADKPPLTIAISGASGAVASNLIPFLTTAGHTVRRLVRRGAAGNDIAWDATTGAVGRDALAQCDALVHLAGKNIATRWTKRARDEIYRSRVDATRRLCETLAAMPNPPRTLICASAVGYYGDRGDETLDESSPPGSGFAADMCVAWENATQVARDAGIRVVNLRIGVVISANSGAIAKLLTPTRLGLAGPTGGGAQWVPWIAMDDLVYAIAFALRRDDLAGPINAVSGSVRQRDFIHTLGRVVRRPTFAPMPAVVVKTLFGQMGEELLLASAKVTPARLDAVGFTPTFPTLEASLRFELGRMK